jgi:hypothetical protein
MKGEQTKPLMQCYEKTELSCRKRYIHTGDQGEDCMLKRSILFVISVLFISTIVVAQNPSPRTPEHIRYYFVFRQLSLLDQKAVAAESKGEDGSRYRQHYKKFALLNDHQMSQLGQIANECLREVDAYDARIKQLVNEARAGIPRGKLEQGAPLPEQDAELKQIDAERNKIMRLAYTRLIDAFGETEFTRFNERVEKSMRVSPRRVGARKNGPREIPTIATEGELVNGVTIMQENGGNILFYTATILDAAVYVYYDGIVQGTVYADNTLIYSDIAVGGPIVELMATIPAVPATVYTGFGDHALSAIYSYPNGWLDPYCFSMWFPLPCEFRCDPPCYTLSRIIYLGYTSDSITTQSGQ